MLRSGALLPQEEKRMLHCSKLGLSSKCMSNLPTDLEAGFAIASTRKMPSLSVRRHKKGFNICHVAFSYNQFYVADGM